MQEWLRLKLAEVMDTAAGLPGSNPPKSMQPQQIESRQIAGGEFSSAHFNYPITVRAEQFRRSLGGRIPVTCGPP